MEACVRSVWSISSPFSIFSQLPSLDFGLKLEEKRYLKKSRKYKHKTVPLKVIYWKLQEGAAAGNKRWSLSCRQPHWPCWWKCFSWESPKTISVSFFGKRKVKQNSLFSTSVKNKFSKSFFCFPPSLFSLCILLARNKIKKKWEKKKGKQSRRKKKNHHVF